MKILHLDSSARKNESISRKLAKDLVNKIKKNDDEVIYRDISENIPFVSGIKGAGFIIPEEERTEKDKELFKFSDQLVDEFLESNTIVISTPIYNFGPPAAAKAWFDMIARAGRTFKYETTGPVGLVDGNKKVYLVVTSGGVPVGSPVDFCTTWFKQALNFLGIADIEVIDASQLNINDDNLKKAQEKINNL
ncbi:MAG: NAD(P)H-dependent oxidoreductase [Pelagibacteraceae bacterium]|jgi:FMN-dependent NADH-azoreductase